MGLGMVYMYMPIYCMLCHRFMMDHFHDAYIGLSVTPKLINECKKRHYGNSMFDFYCHVIHKLMGLSIDTQ